MTVLSRSKNAAARVTRHDCKWTGPAWPRPRAVHTRTSHPQFLPDLALSAHARMVPAVSVAPHSARPCPPPRRQRRRGAARRPPPPARRRRQPSPRSPPAARRCAGPTGTPRWSSSAPTRSPRGAVRAAAAAARGRGRRPRGELPAPRSGRRRWSWVPSGWRCCPADEAWLLVPGRPRRSGHRWSADWLVAVGGSCGGAGASTVADRAGAGGRSRVPCSSTPIPGAAGSTCCSGAERAEGLRWPELTGLRGRVAGDALLAALPEVGGVHVLAASRGTPAPMPDEALLAVVEAARSAGRPVVVDLPRRRRRRACAGRTGARRRRSRGARRPGAAARRHRGPAAGRRTRLAVVRRRSSSCGRSRGGLSRDDVAEVVGRPVLAELPHDRSAVPRGERGEPPAVSARSPLGGLRPARPGRAAGP